MPRISKNLLRPVLLFLLLLVCYSLVYLSQMDTSVISPIVLVKAGVKVLLSCLFVLSLYWLLPLFWLRQAGLLLVSLNLAVVAYISVIFGKPSIGILTSMLETDQNEASEFLTNLDLGIVAYAAGLAGCVYLVAYHLYRSSVLRSRWSIIAPACYLAFLSVQAIAIANKDTPYWADLLRSDVNTRLVAFSMEYSDSLEQEAEPITSDWLSVRQQGERKDVSIVVLGESAMPTHFAFYGYDRPTTPRLAEINNIRLVHQAIAPAVLTRNSVPRILAVNDKTQVQSGLNVIDLARDAGYETVWLSNQGQTSRHDSPVTRFARRADQQVFLANYYTEAKSDFVLIPELQRVLDARGYRDQVIFMHTIGSHFNFCDRIEGAPRRLPGTIENVYLDCYDNTVLNTYALLEQVQAELSARQLSYRLVYLSDHGLVATSRKPYLTHGNGKLFSPRALDVPMFFLEDHKVDQALLDRRYFIRDFPHTFAHWMGIEAQQTRVNLSVLSDSFRESSQSAYGLNDQDRLIEYN